MKKDTSKRDPMADETQRRDKPTGAGAEATSGVDGAGGGGSQTDVGNPVHKGSYGGEGGEPRTSSDQRERSNET